MVIPFRFISNCRFRLNIIEALSDLKFEGHNKFVFIEYVNIIMTIISKELFRTVTEKVFSQNDF